MKSKSPDGSRASLWADFLRREMVKEFGLFF